ncbi:insulin-degrading enzyme-like protein [Sarcoptes scabiei]|uniref:Insulin-degrading enzyme-like protein n=1 Tax=Sarcoptes scabiei TaxID=52283 RepID=A0A132A6Q4_SARSC|nr:insulin-degrading enzyme-like protein [Sarcoptes scabiei]
MAEFKLRKYENILKPLEDKRDYLGLRLENDLKVMLISDPETDISAASLSVNVGSMSDPWPIQGLAHFLEHMLFMGTKKYPVENEYSKYLSQHGGDSNAYTTETSTNYFFDVKPEFLAPSLDIFSQFFIDPLMLEDSVNRELEAVNKNLDELIKMVVPLFTPIQNRNVEPPKWLINPYDQNSLMKQVQVVPVKDKRSLELIFVYPDELEHYKSSPGTYLSHLIGHESKGSLLSELKKRGLSSSLYSYFDSKNGFGFFFINVDLSEKGLKQTDEIIILIFQYIKMLKLFIINFFGLSLSKYFPFEDVLSPYLIFGDFKPELIDEHIEYLKPENCTVVITSKSFEGKTDSKEKYFDIDYKIIDLPKDLIEKLKTVERNEALRFPNPNPFIPDDFQILCSKPNDNLPVLIHNDDHMKIWHLNDQVYKKPKVFYSFKLVNITEFLYDAQLAGLSVRISNAIYGLNLEFYGYNQKMEVFFQNILDKLVNFEVDSERFEILKEKYVRNLKNYPTQPLYYLASYYLKLMTSEYSWSYDELIESLDQIKPQSFQNWLPMFFMNFSTEALLHGNINEEGALRIVDFIRRRLIDHFKSVPIKSVHLTRPRAIVLENGCSFSYEIVNDIQKPKLINIYFQTSFESMNDISKLFMVNKILSEPFFDHLRTKEQLGYVVYSKFREFSGCYGLCFVVESEFNVLYLEDRVEAFIDLMKQRLEELSLDEFESEKESLITKLLKKKKKMIDYSRELWVEIEKNEYFFSKNERLAEIIQKLTKEEIIEFYKKNFDQNSPDRKKIVIRIQKSDAEANKTLPTFSNKEELYPAPERKESVPIDDPKEFTKYKALFPLPISRIVLSKPK